MVHMSFGFIIFVVQKFKELGLPDDMTTLGTSDRKIVDLFFPKLQTGHMHHMSTVGDQRRDFERAVTLTRSDEWRPAEDTDNLGQQFLFRQHWRI